MRLGIHDGGDRRLAQKISSGSKEFSGNPLQSYGSPNTGDGMMRSNRGPINPTNDSLLIQTAPNFSSGRAVYASGGSAHTGNMVKQGANTTVFTPPTFYSPYHTASAWQIPSNRREIYRLCEYWTTNEPRVAIGIDFYCDFPCNGFELVCKNRSVRTFFEKLCRKIKLEDKFPEILREYYGKGDAFVMANIDCKHCHGSGYRQDGKICDHKGATWASLSILNPEEVEVTPWTHILGDDPPVYITPNAELKKIVQSGRPEEVYKRIPEETKAAVKSNQPIKIDPLSIHHFKHGAPSYQTYGVSLIRRLFPTLFYRDKLRQAQWLIAERHIVPIKIVKIGTPERPATVEDISAVQDQLSEVANDPLLTIVTHHAFDYEWIGACLSNSCQVLTKDGFKEFGNVGEDDLIACYDPDTGCIAYHPYIERYEYEYDSDIHGPLLDFQGKHYGVTVTNNHMMWTGKRIWDSSASRYRNEWQKVRADEIEDHDRFLTSVEPFEGVIPDELPYIADGPKILSDVELNDFLRFLGYYLSEGSLQSQAKPYDSKMCSVYIYQNRDTDAHRDIESTMRRCFGSKLKSNDDDRYAGTNTAFKVHNTELAEWIRGQFGHGADEKRIPRWILDLPHEHLSILMDALVAGDGDTRKSENGHNRTRYSTTSKRLADDVQEMAFKLGFNAKMKLEERLPEAHSDMYRVYWSELGSTRSYSVVRSDNISSKEYKGLVWCFEVPTGIFITRQDGFIGIHGNSGKVLQLTNEFDLIEGEMIDGLGLSKAILSGEGPTYANAQVGIEVLIKRLETVRQKLKHWIEEKIFRPIAEFNDFTEIDERGDTETLIYPEVQWNELRLRDNTAQMQYMWEARKTGEVSARTFLEKMLGVDFESEVEELRLEEMSTMLSSPQIDLGTIDSMMGGGFGGGGPMMPPEMAGMMPPPMPPMGAAPGPPMGGGALPEGVPAGALPPAPTASVLEHNYLTVTALANAMRAEPVDRSVNMSRIAQVYENAGVITVDRSAVLPIFGDGYRGPLPDDPDMMVLWSGVSEKWGAPGISLYGIGNSKLERFAFTDPRLAGKDERERVKPNQYLNMNEGRLLKAILQQRYPYQFWAQYAINSDMKYRVDFAFPQLKIAIEADGEQWHGDPEAIEHDKQRDAQLASQGWIVLRFRENEIEDQIDQVIAIITKVIQSKINSVGTRAIASNPGTEMVRINGHSG